VRGRTRLIVTIAGTLVVLLLTYFFLVSPKRGELGDAREAVAAEEQRTVGLRTELQRLQALEEEAPQLRADLAELEELVPKRHDIPNFIFLVQEAANSSGVGFVQITPELPKSPPEGAPLAEVRIAISARGGYFAIQDFIRRLYDLDRALRVDILAMSAEQAAAEGGGGGQQETTTRIALEITSRIFFELPAGGATGGTAAPAPVATPPAEPAEGEPTDEEPGATPSPSPAG